LGAAFFKLLKSGRGKRKRGGSRVPGRFAEADSVDVLENGEV